MWQKQSINLRVLIIEDHLEQRVDLADDLKEIPADKLEIFHIRDIRIDEADCLEAGLEKLRTAVSRSIPYHLVLLDLGIPIKPRDPGLQEDISDESETENGFEILKFINREGGALGVVVHSIFDLYDHVRRTFQQNAIEFISKRAEAQTLQTSVLDAWMRVLKRQSDQSFQRRIETLIPLLKSSLVHYMTKPFSQLVLSVSDHLTQLEDQIKDRYGIDPALDPEDSMAKSLLSQKDAVRDAQTAWRSHQEAISDDRPKIRRLEAVLRRLEKSLMPCLAVKRVNLRFELSAQGKTSIVTFQDDLYAVLREIILGAIGPLPDSETESSITITMESEIDTHVVLLVEDDLEPISAQSADRINRGTEIVQDVKLGRAWGLSIVQQVALRAGGQLEVKPGKLQGNLITYKIQTAAAYA
jgi:DNA-binding NarL/FixJ family response regulator